MEPLKSAQMYLEALSPLQYDGGDAANLDLTA